MVKPVAAALALALAWLPAAALAAPAVGVEDPRMVEARKACAAGDVDKGIKLLVDYLSATDDPTLIYNMARCYEQNGVVDKARLQFQEYLRKAKNLSAEDRAEVNEHIRALEAEQERRARLQTPAAPAAAPVAVATSSTGSAPQPGARPAQPAQPAVETRQRRFVLILPYIGAHMFQGDSQDSRFTLIADGRRQAVGLGPGFRLGAMLGLRPADAFSINGELTIDFLNPKNVPDMVDLSAAAVELSLSPMLHFGQGQLELAIGPKVGAWATVVQAKVKDSLIDSMSKASASGYVFGGNVGAFARMSDVASIGLLVSYVVRNVRQVCVTTPGLDEMCGDPERKDNDKVLGITAAMLF